MEQFYFRRINEAEVQFGIVLRRYEDELHRGPMTEAEVDAWIQEFLDDGGKPGTFIKVSRTVSPWKVL